MRATPPSRWLLVLTILVVVVFTVMRVTVAASLDLRSDEAYYWTWSHQWVLSFLDQPPMVAWFERAGQLFFGDTPLGARVAQLVSLPLIEMLLADIARRRTRSWNAALFVVLAIECATNYGVFVVVVEPSTPLLLFTSVMLWSLCRLDETMAPRWWLAIGVAGGLALLSKYTVVMLAPALIVFLVITPKHRAWLASPWPYLAVLIAAAIFSPVLIWNAIHNWVSFTFQGVRLGGGGASQALRFAAYELLFVGLALAPAAVIASVVLTIRGLRRKLPFEAAIAVAFLLPLAVFALRSLTLQINQSWTWFLWPIGVLALALALPWGTAPKRIAALAAAIAATGLPVVAVFLYHAGFDQSVWFRADDPFGNDAGYAKMADDVLAVARANNARWIATTDYRTYANLQWHIGTAIPVLQVNERARFLDFAPLDASRFTGRALYVHLRGGGKTLGGKLSPLPSIPVTWRGQLMQRIEAGTLDGFTPELDPAPGSPAFVAQP